MKTVWTICIALAALALAPACSDADLEHEHAHDGGHQHDGTHQHGDSGTGDVDKEGCEHLKQGPYVDLTAGVDAKGAPQVKADHKAYRVALAAGQAGYLSFAAADKGDHLLYLDRNPRLQAQDDKGQAVAIESSVTSIAACTEVKARHTVELPAAGTYYLVLGPETANSKVTLVVEPAGHKH